MLDQRRPTKQRNRIKYFNKDAYTILLFFVLRLIQMVEEICYCGERLTWISEYNRYYCNKCQTYPPTCPECQQDLSWVPTYSHYYCNRCQGYKESIPSPITTTSTSAGKHSLKEIETAFRKLKESYQNGSIDEAKYKETLEKMKFNDDQRRYWTIGAQTGKWYYYNGSSWVEDKPRQTFLVGQIIDAKE